LLDRIYIGSEARDFGKATTQQKANTALSYLIQAVKLIRSSRKQACSYVTAVHDDITGEVIERICFGLPNKTAVAPMLDLFEAMGREAKN
jgi:hypothetical protein